MNIELREFSVDDIEEAIFIWNQVVDEGVAFPQLERLNRETGLKFFKEQSYTGIAVNVESNEIVGLYILHPNNVGRCGHICNASYAVKEGLRGHHIGESLVRHCLDMGRKFDFKILQFNAVVESNTTALALYEKLGFTRLGTIPQGFLMPDGCYENIVPHYKCL